MGGFSFIMNVRFSLIIPVFNRPEEIRELLQSLVFQTYTKDYEIVIIEDGSTHTAEAVVSSFHKELDITYHQKENSGPGDSRNFGMKKAKGNYFIVLDSDCVLPEHYLEVIDKALQIDFVHCFGGPDAAHKSFTSVQKAIDFAMTSFLTTGGIRGGKTAVGRFQPRSFNMGISKEAFEKTSGFGKIHPGEDPDLTFRIWKAGYETRLISNAYVYHKRRIDWGKFFKQVKKFGLVRPILNKWHPGTSKITYWFPTLFCLGLFLAIALAIVGFYWLLLLYALYFLTILIVALFKYNSLKVGLLAIVAVLIQFVGYGLGFIKSSFLVTFSKEKPEKLFPKLFFN